MVKGSNTDFIGLKRCVVAMYKDIGLLEGTKARLRELDELANISHVTEFGPETNQPKLSCYIDQKAEKVKASTRSKVIDSPGAKSPTPILPFFAQPNEGTAISNSNGVCLRSEESEALNQTRYKMAASEEMECGAGPKLHTFHRKEKSTCEVSTKEAEPISQPKKQKKKLLCDKRGKKIKQMKKKVVGIVLRSGSSSTNLVAGILVLISRRALCSLQQLCYGVNGFRWLIKQSCCWYLVADQQVGICPVLFAGICS
ncbi:hypothetical protein U1Q18_022840 [Sarracenia purpurea var. burkii]